MTGPPDQGLHEPADGVVITSAGRTGIFAVMVQNYHLMSPLGLQEWRAQLGKRLQGENLAAATNADPTEVAVFLVDYRDSKGFYTFNTLQSQLYSLAAKYLRPLPAIKCTIVDTGLVEPVVTVEYGFDWGDANDPEGIRYQLRMTLVAVEAERAARRSPHQPSISFTSGQFEEGWPTSMTVVMQAGAHDWALHPEAVTNQFEAARRDLTAGLAQLHSRLYRPPT